MTWGGEHHRIGVKKRQKHPLKHDTPIGLRRICGNCRHFDGGQTTSGTCTRHFLDAHGLQSARDCADWTRPDPVEAVQAVRPVIPRDEQPARPAPVAGDRLAAIQECAAAGMSIRQTAIKLGLPRYKVTYAAQKYNVEFPGKHGEAENANAPIRAALLEGETDFDKLATRYGKTLNSIKLIAWRLRAK
jgi:hypothetical protein